MVPWNSRISRPTSPALANLALGHLDVRLAGWAAAVDATYTRYADDLTFSGGDALVAVAAAPLVGSATGAPSANECLIPR